ncbi:MAG: UvrD-helicase domain-containing protein, partial [Candidatus Latescibacterota bacterium]
PLQDQTARDRIKNDLTQNFMVQAGAGAGKTYSLVGRMVEVITKGHAHIENIAAITFTRKAAGEMRGRFFNQLRKSFQTEQDPNIKDNLQEALRNIDRCFIGTIHSFCSRLLRERPVEAGLSPDFAELEERDEEIIRSEFWHGYLQQSFSDNDPALNTIDDLGIRVHDLYTFFKERCRFNDLPLKPTQTDKPNLERAKKATFDLIDETLEHIPDELPEGTDKFMETLEQAKHMRRYRDLDDPAVCIQFLKLFDKKSSGITLKKWGANKAYAKLLKDEDLPHLQEQYITPLLTQWKQYVYTHVVTFIDQAVQAYDDHRHQEAQLTFQDLLLKATELLRKNPEIRAFFKDRYHCLFIDEFQDTDPIQAEMLFYLTGSDIQEQDWQKLSP